MKAYSRECYQLFVVYFLVYMILRFVLEAFGQNPLFVQSVLSNAFLGYGLLVALLVSAIGQRLVSPPIHVLADVILSW